MRLCPGRPPDAPRNARPGLEVASIRRAGNGGFNAIGRRVLTPSGFNAIGRRKIAPGKSGKISPESVNSLENASLKSKRVNEGTSLMANYEQEGSEEPPPGHRGGEEPTPGHCGSEEPTPVHRGGEEPTPGHRGSEEPTPGHRGSEEPSKDDDENESIKLSTGSENLSEDIINPPLNVENDSGKAESPARNALCVGENSKMKVRGLDLGGGGRGGGGLDLEQYFLREAQSGGKEQGGNKGKVESDFSCTFSPFFTVKIRQGEEEEEEEMEEEEEEEEDGEMAVRAKVKDGFESNNLGVTASLKGLYMTEFVSSPN